ncbi:MAG TPA: N-formylglutamate amidohydrolase [Alphaproteobacteria bacterium]|nr:N-formylglutamate amidohydrolase [Alphaproteobacteria bacterium]
MSFEPAAVNPIDPPFAVIAPPQQTAAVVYASPHSGNRYPPGFVTGSRLDPLTLRRSEDAFVDELFAGAPERGAPLLKAFFPRAYIDPNREPWELDPTMFADALPSYVNGASPRVSAGLGTIARVVANGAEIYRGKLSFADARLRIETLYRPYHEHLQGLIDATYARFGHALLIDCHSMPSVGGPTDRDAGKRRVDFVLGDCFGASCAPAVMRETESFLRRQGFAVARNDPYAGGFTTRHYGQPARGRHALQIEINRGLYMDELRIERSGGFAALKRALDGLIEALTDIAAALPRG